MSSGLLMKWNRWRSQITGHSDGVSSVAFSPPLSGSGFTFDDQYKTLKLWNLMSTPR
jgi:WD40 repeat protein